MDVRPLTGADRAAWQPLWEGYLSFYDTELDPDVTEVVFHRLVDPGWPAQAGWLAVVDGRAVGLAHVGLQPSTWAVEPDGYLEDLFVAPAARGAGVGRALLDHLAVVGGEQGWRRLHWLTDEDNTTARRLYDAVGTRPGVVRYERPVVPAEDG